MTISEITAEIVRLRSDALESRVNLRKGGSQQQRYEKKATHLAEYWLGQEVALAMVLQFLEQGNTPK